MKVFHLFCVYLVFIPLFLCHNVTDSQSTDTDISTNATRTPRNTSEDEKKGKSVNIKHGRVSENKERNAEKTFKLPNNFKKRLNDNNFTSKGKSMQVPLNLVIDNKRRTIPIKIPLVIKTANVKPAPAHYIRLAADPQRKHSKLKPKINSNLNKEGLEKKLHSKDIGKSMSNNSTHRQDYNFFEDDTNKSTLSSMPATKKLRFKYNSTAEIASKKAIHNESKHGTYDIERGSACNDTADSENETHAIVITKLPSTIKHKPECKAENNDNLDQKMQEQVVLEIPSTTSEVQVPTKVENINVAGLVKDSNVQQAGNKSEINLIEPSLREQSNITFEKENDSSDVITIKNQNYEEYEERTLPAMLFEETGARGTSSGISDPWRSQLSNPVLQTPYYTYIQNYQISNDNCLKYTPFYSENYGYPYSNMEQFLYKNTPTTQAFSFPTQFQDIYGQYPKTQSNAINTRPENCFGRIWRTWKDTEIKYRKPNCVSDEPLRLGKDVTKMVFNKFTPHTPMVYRPRIANHNRCYQNVNMNPYPYSYRTNRYAL